MLERVNFFEQHFGKIYIEGWRLVHHSIIGGPDFNTWYSKVWKDARFKWAHTQRVAPIDEDALRFEFKEYDTTFPPFFLIFWQEEIDDYKWMLGEIPPSDPEVLDAITELAAQWSKKLLPDQDFSVPDAVIYNPTSSNAFDGSLDTNPEWTFEYEAPDSDYMDDYLIFARSYAFKRPTESRDIGIMTPQSMRLHKKVMYPLQRACRRIRGSVYGRDANYIRKIVSQLGDENRYFYMRDYTKSGMTIPHAVICAVFRGFYRSEPALAETACKAFTLAQLHIKDPDGNYESTHLSSGVPLGMFVEGYTLLQYLCNQYVSEQIGYNLDFNGNNDDMIVASRSLDRLQQYVNTDQALQADLGMSVKGTKTGISHDRFIYAEEYWNGTCLESKDVLYAMAILGAKWAINVTHAKELVASILASCRTVSHPIHRAVVEVQSSYMYEFSDQEYRWPVLFGGWWPTYRAGLDASIEWRNGDLIADCAYWASRARVQVKSRLKDHATMTLSRRYHMQLISPPDDPAVLINLKPLFGNKKTIGNLFTLMSRSPRDTARFYKELYLKRRRLFSDYLSGKVEMPSVLNGYIRRHPNTVIIPGMDGVSYSRDGFVVTHPRLGKEVDSFEASIRYWVNQGWIDASVPTRIGHSEVRAHAVGITKEFAYDFLPVAEGGSSLFLLTHHVPAVQDLYYMHGLYIRSVDSQDYQLSITRHWDYIPIPLLLLYRLDTAINKNTALPPISLATSTAYFRSIVGMNVNTRLASTWDPDEEPDAAELPLDDCEFERLLKTLLDSISLANFKARIRPAALEQVGEVLNGAVGPSDGTVQYILKSEGSWVPARTDQYSTDFWDQPASDEDMPQFPWD
jgi:hypothetical protein